MICRLRGFDRRVDGYFIFDETRGPFFRTLRGIGGKGNTRVDRIGRRWTAFDDETRVHSGRIDVG